MTRLENGFFSTIAETNAFDVRQQANLKAMAKAMGTSCPDKEKKKKRERKENVVGHSHMMAFMLIFLSCYFFFLLSFLTKQKKLRCDHQPDQGQGREKVQAQRAVPDGQRQEVQEVLQPAGRHVPGQARRLVVRTRPLLRYINNTYGTMYLPIACMAIWHMHFTILTNVINE